MSQRRVRHPRATVRQSSLMPVQDISPPGRIWLPGRPLRIAKIS
jgi:hypothetical protein